MCILILAGKKKQKKHASNSFWPQPLGFEFSACTCLHGLLLTNKLLSKSNSLAHMSSKWPWAQKVCFNSITRLIWNGPLQSVSEGSATLGTHAHVWHAAAKITDPLERNTNVSRVPRFWPWWDLWAPLMKSKLFKCPQNSWNWDDPSHSFKFSLFYLNQCFRTGTQYISCFRRLRLNLCCISKAVSFSSLTKASQGLWRSNSVGQFDLFSWITVKNVQTASDLCQPSRTERIYVTEHRPMICRRTV